jgi:hypothetical protein
MLFVASLILLSGTSRAQDAQDQEDEQDVVEEFITTRGVSFAQPGAKPTPPRNTSGARKGGSSPRPAAKKSRIPPTEETAKKRPPADKGATGESGGANDGASSATGATAAVKASAQSGTMKPIGLGFTLFMRQGENLVVAEPSREFRAGDRLRIALETNTDGYLYIFHTENGQKPQMIFPNPQIDGGANSIAAHSRDFVPADLSAWFQFDDVPATERLYLVVARNPLAGVPTGADLVAFCGDQRDDCYWTPTPSHWERIRSGVGRFVEGRNPQLAKLTPPPGAMTRGIKVKKDEPAPAIVRVNDSADADVFITTIDLIHK